MVRRFAACHWSGVMWNKLRDWYLALIGIIVIAGGLYIASHSGSNDGSGEGASQADRIGFAQAPAAPPAPAHASQPNPNVGAMPGPIAGGDPAPGKLVFRKCQVCHSLEPGKDVLGPSLAGIIGRKSGAAPNYAYSPAMKDANLTWDAKTLDAYLDDPQKMVPGNKMPFPGLKTVQDRLDVIAYMAAPSGSPAAPTPAAAAQPPSAQAQQNAPAPIAAYVPD